MRKTSRRRALIGCACLMIGRVLYLADAAQPAQSFRFAVLGDRTGETVPGVYEGIWRQIGQEQPSFVINVGDTIQGMNDAAAEAEWRQLRPLWTRYPIPLYLIPGNHDIWSVKSRQIYEKSTGRAAFYSFDRGSAHFTVLDNSGSLQLGEAQMSYLQKDLEAHRASPLKFVFFHQPFWLLPLKLQSTDFPFHLLMRKYRVTAVFCGHVHQFSRMHVDGITYMVVGSSGGHLRGHDPNRDFTQGWFFHHLLVEVEASGVKLQVIEAAPPYGKERSFDARRWGEPGLQ